MIEKELFTMIKNVLKNSGEFDSFQDSEYLELMDLNKRTDQAVIIGVNDGQRIAPGVPFWKFSILLGISLRSTFDKDRAKSNQYFQALRNIASNQIELLKGSSGEDFQTIDAIHIDNDLKTSAGFDENDKFFIRQINLVCFLTR